MAAIEISGGVPLEGEVWISGAKNAVLPILVASLLGDASATRAFDGGRFATIYLAPWNYHRLHMPLSGRLTRTVFVPGR